MNGSALLRRLATDNRITEHGAIAIATALEYNQALLLLSLRGASVAFGSWR